MPANREHTASYYAAAARQKTDYQPLDGDLSVDVAVVGGGFTGTSSALALAERGYNVALLEANRIGWGASGRNGGQLIDGMVEIDKIEKRAGPEAAGIAYRMGIECRDIVLRNIEKYAIDCDLKFGYLDLAMNDDDVRQLRREVDRKRARHYPHDVRFVPREELHELIKSPRYVAGLVNKANGHLQPLDLCVGEARAAEKNGAKIFEQTQVTRIRHGRSPRVETERGTVHARKVVLAGNAYLGKTEPALSGSVIPAGSYIIATEPLGDELARELLPQDTACCDLRVGLDYFRLSADKRMLFGGMCSYSGRVPKSIEGSLKPKMTRAFPQLANVRVDYAWGGNIAISLNRIPQFGRIQDNTYYAQGYSGHGVAPTHVAGQVMADVIAGDSERFDVFARIRHLRLPGGRLFANPALALGMLYFRLKEVL